MMYYLVEDPTAFIFLGIVAEAVLGILLFKTGRGFLLWIMLGVLLFCLAGMIGQRFIITERKRVVQTLDGIVAALEANDLNALNSYLEPENAHSRNDARFALGMAKIEGAKYSKLTVEINDFTSPPTATVTFFGLVNFTAIKGDAPYNNYASNIKLKLRKHQDHWLVEDHELQKAIR
ncbi:MAG: hypothetical protein IT426_05755 [Pirellulales bacterium]|nr:hypothetical protein [Pirellulales bacterium]